MRRSLPAALAVLFALVLALVTTASAPAMSRQTAEHERREGTNPTIAQKMLGYDAWVRDHEGAPDLLVLGSSRSVQVDPVLIQQLTGMTTYNGGISTAGTRELRVLTSFADLRTPGDLPQLLVMLDIEMFDNRRPTTRVVDYQGRIDGTYRRCPRAAACRRAWQLSAQRLVRDARRRQDGGRPMRQTQRGDGRLINGSLERLEAQGVDLSAVLERRIGLRIRSYRRGGFDRVYPRPRAAFERLLRIANARGVEPVVVLTTMHPDCVRRCGPAGWNARRLEVRRQLREFARTRDFQLVDLSYLSSWGGTEGLLLDDVHLRLTGAERLVRHLVRIGALRAEDATATS